MKAGIVQTRITTPIKMKKAGLGGQPLGRATGVEMRSQDIGQLRINVDALQNSEHNQEQEEDRRYTRVVHSGPGEIED